MTLADMDHVGAVPFVGKAASLSTYGGGIGAILAGLDGQLVAAWGGLVVAILGLVISFWHKRAMQRIARDRLDWEMGKGAE